jgi:hypothetical protein
MQKTILQVIFAAVMVGLFPFNALATDDGAVRIYDNSEFRELANSPQLMVSLGIVADFGTLPFATEASVMKDVLKKAAKVKAEGIHPYAPQQKKGDNGWGLKGYQLHIGAEAFRFAEPTLANIRAEIHNPRNKTQVSNQNVVNQAVKNNYKELAFDMLDEVLNSKKDHNAKNILLDGYVALAGDNASGGLKQVASANLPYEIHDHVGKLLAQHSDTDGLYHQIVDASDMQAARLVATYSTVATSKDIPNLRKLLKLHSSDTVRTEAGKALVRLNDTAYVEEALQSEKSVEVAKAVKKEMLLH